MDFSVTSPFQPPVAYGYIRPKELGLEVVAFDLYHGPPIFGYACASPLAIFSCTYTTSFYIEQRHDIQFTPLFTFQPAIAASRLSFNNTRELAEHRLQPLDVLTFVFLFFLFPHFYFIYLELPIYASYLIIGFAQTNKTKYICLIKQNKGLSGAVWRRRGKLSDNLSIVELGTQKASGRLEQRNNKKIGLLGRLPVSYL